MEGQADWTIVTDVGMLPRKNNAGFGHVYVVEYKDCIKIGHSTNLRSRLHTLKSSAANYSSISIGKIAYTRAHTNYKEIEIYLHKMYNPHRINNGELFQISWDNFFHTVPLLLPLYKGVDEGAMADMVKFQELYTSWKEQYIHPCGLGVFGPVSTEYKLTYTEATILGWVNLLYNKRDAVFAMIDDKRYVWVYYPLFIQQFPMVKVMSSHNLSTQISELIRRGLLEKHTRNDSMIGHRVYLHIPEDIRYFLFYPIGPTEKLEGVCREWVDYKTRISLEGEHGSR